MTKTHDKADKSRFTALQAVGCVCCFLRSGKWGTPSDVHHLLSGGRRRGHQFTIPLCEWHHRAVPRVSYTPEWCGLHLGPSLAKGSRAFHKMFGSDNDLLIITNQKLERIHEL